MANPKRPRDPNQLAKLIVGIASGEEADVKPKKKSEAAAELAESLIPPNRGPYKKQAKISE